MRHSQLWSTVTLAFALCIVSLFLQSTDCVASDEEMILDLGRPDLEWHEIATGVFEATVSEHQTTRYYIGQEGLAYQVREIEEQLDLIRLTQDTESAAVLKKMAFYTQTLEYLKEILASPVGSESKDARCNFNYNLWTQAREGYLGGTDWWALAHATGDIYLGNGGCSGVTSCTAYAWTEFESDSDSDSGDLSCDAQASARGWDYYCAQAFSFANYSGTSFSSSDTYYSDTTDCSAQ